MKQDDEPEAMLEQPPCPAMVLSLYRNIPLARGYANCTWSLGTYRDDSERGILTTLKLSRNHLSVF